MDVETFRADPKTVAAVERKLQVISEAAIRLGDQAEVLCAGLPWRDIRGIGNWLRHQYDRVDVDSIWRTVTDDLPPLEDAIIRALQNPSADQSAYDKHCQGYHESLAPTSPVEIDLVQSIADDRWRMKRAAAIESCIFAEGIALPHDDAVAGHAEIDAALAQATVWLQKSGSIQLLALYESRIQRRFERNMAELRTLQTERKEALQQAVEKAALILELAEEKGAAFDVETEIPEGAIPAKFVFSLAQIKSLATFERCVIAAKRLSAERSRPYRRAA